MYHLIFEGVPTCITITPLQRRDKKINKIKIKINKNRNKKRNKTKENYNFKTTRYIQQVKTEQKTRQTTYIKFIKILQPLGGKNGQ